MSEPLRGGVFAPSTAAVPGFGGVVVPYPSVPAAGEVVWRDEAGEVAGTLMRWGVRYTVLRWIPRATLLALWREVRGYEPPAGTRACWEGGPVWVDEARRRIGAQGWQQRRKDTYLAVGVEYAASCVVGQAPLTTATQERVAERVGICKRYVSKILRWYQEQGLLGQVLRGTRTKRVEVPAGETDQEREARMAAEAVELAVRREQIAAAKARWRAGVEHARAELGAVRAGEPVPPAPDGFAEFRTACGDLGEDQVDELELDLAAVLAVRLATVYELRVPADPEPALASPRGGVVVDLRAERGRRRTEPPAQVNPAEGSVVPAAGHRPGARLSLVPAPTSADAETFLPNPVLGEILSSPDGVGVVDNTQNRGASRRSDQRAGGDPGLEPPECDVAGAGRAVGSPAAGSEGSGDPCELIAVVPGATTGPVLPFPGQRPNDHRCRAERAAARLLGHAPGPQAGDTERLPQRLTWGVSVAWLAAGIRSLVDHGWTDAELVDQLTTHGGRFAHLPVRIPNPRGFITNVLAGADPKVRPAVRAAVTELETDNEHAARRRQHRITEQDEAGRRERARLRQAAIDACPHCDTQGWTLLDGAGPEVRCDHPAGPAPAPEVAPVAVSRAAIAAQLAQRRADRAAAATALRRGLLAQARARDGEHSDTTGGVRSGQMDPATLVRHSSDRAGPTFEERHQIALNRARTEPGRR